MSQGSDEQPLNFGSDLSLRACWHNCKEGECCECDHHPSEASSGYEQQAYAGTYQQPTARESLQSIASSGRGPSQPRPIVGQQYQSMDAMFYGSPEGGYPTPQGYGDVDIAAQYPSGFTTQPSSYPDSTQANPTYDRLGYFRDGYGRLMNSMGQYIDEFGNVLPFADSYMPQASPGAASSSTGSGGSFATAKTHYSRSSGSNNGSSHSHKHHDKKEKIR
ncbi:hypothetical protein diail_4531 [Diaporthe ilicicola]|nr:hypothetical protein diail_4531 [Diaporthe ilicicola]